MQRQSTELVLREWVRLEQCCRTQPSEDVIDNQSVKSVAFVHEAVGYHRGNKIKGRKRFAVINVLGSVARVFVRMPVCPKGRGGARVLSQVEERGVPITQLNLIWADGGFDGPAFMMGGWIPVAGLLRSPL